MVNNLINFLKSKYILALLGFTFLIYYVWYRFIRERLPKGIPLELSNYSLLFLLLLCILYIYVILRLVKPKAPTKPVLKIMGFVAKIQVIFISLDETIRKNKYVDRKIEVILLYIVKLLHTPTLYYHSADKLYLLYTALTKILPLLSLIIDIFLFKKIHYFYYSLMITICPLLINYIIYLLKMLNQKYLNILSDYMVEITSEDDEDIDYYMQPSSLTYDDIAETQYDKRYKYLTIERFIEIQSIAIMWEDVPFAYRLFHKTEREDVIYLSGAPIKNDMFTTDYINQLLESALALHIISETISIRARHKIVKRTKICIPLAYLIVWVYVLLTANFANVGVDINYVLDMLNETWLNLDDPFIGVPP